MYAIIKTGGRQYIVTEGEVLDVELLDLEQGASIEFPVLFVSDGSNHNIGEPAVEGFVVRAEVIGESAGPKVQGVKYRPRKRQDRKFGHRQHYSRIKIKAIAKAA